MVRKWIVVADDAGFEREEAITWYLQGRGFRFWHWFADLWLLTDVPDGVSPRGLAGELKRIPTLARCSILVMTVEEVPLYFGYGPQGGWPWLSREWGRVDTDPPEESSRSSNSTGTPCP